MNLWVCGLVLVVGVTLSSSTATNEECETLVKPKATFEPMYGKWTFILGYSDNSVYDNMFKSTQSQWIEFKQTGDSKVMMEDIGIRHPTYCKYASTLVRIVGNSGISQKSNFTCTFHSLPTCPKCLLYHTTSINNNNLVEVQNATVKEQLKGYRAFYLMSKDSTITAAELEQAKKQAKCLGFGEPTFYYNPQNTFCEKGSD